MIAGAVIIGSDDGARPFLGSLTKMTGTLPVKSGSAILSCFFCGYPACMAIIPEIALEEDKIRRLGLCREHYNGVAAFFRKGA